MNIKDMLCSVGKNDKEQGKKAEMCDDTLCIECKVCSRAPNIRSPECMKCVIDCIAECGGSDRVKMRTSRDLELSGQAAEFMCELANMKRFVVSVHNSVRSRNCKGCENSCESILTLAWSGFPEPHFDAARNRLMRFSPSDSACRGCMQRSYRVLDQAELNMNNFRKRVSLEIARRGGR